MNTNIFKLDHPFELRPMTLADLPAVIAIEKVAYSYPWPEKAYQQELRNDQAYFTTVSYRTTLIGYSGLWHLVDQAHIGTIVSHPKARRKGIGEFLLINAITQAITLAVDTVTLEVRPSNQAAQNLYAKYGFEMVGRRKRYYPDTGEDAIIMTTPCLQNKAFRGQVQVLSQNLAKQLQSFTLN